MDIHHINTGEGNCTFIMMPDGTRILLDAGTVDKKGFEKNNAPLKAIGPRYASTGTIQDALIEYIEWATGSQRSPLVLDYAIISHFHSDHYGAVMDLLPRLDVKTIIDRSYPNYDFPLDLRVKLKDDKLFQRYLQLVDSRLYTIQSLQVGRQDQIVLTKDPKAFPMVHILNIKNNAQVWNPQSNERTELFQLKICSTSTKGV
ncbi:MBL fold metallo-hydrolase [Sphingobacterium sp. E70]|uniref:MBL fold metallo-hydrolase n=1 Tax=Sphingobacterium sp. E70 TaxID=2853439 RepID=UPI00211CC1E3|nr:MBL fold metallo-hydrolase [Sphingobacterium sp. E70]ULT24817.1 MBL fold metallo-hydrolase [Sphingobacterium sp. E70]